MLNAIGELDARQEEILRRMEPKLASLYGAHGSWIEIISSQMDFSEALPEKIRNDWENSLSQARRKGLHLDPNEFAIAFVDVNLLT